MRALAALYFNYGRYLLIACSREDSRAANAQGIWNEHFAAPWSSNYTTNINLEMNYWAAETTGLGECHQPLLQAGLETGVLVRLHVLLALLQLGPQGGFTGGVLHLQLLPQRGGLTQLVQHSGADGGSQLHLAQGLIRRQAPQSPLALGNLLRRVRDGQRRVQPMSSRTGGEHPHHGGTGVLDGGEQHLGQVVGVSDGGLGHQGTAALQVQEQQVLVDRLLDDDEQPLGRQNFELFQKSMQNFAPAASEKASGDSRTEEIDKLTQELAEMQKRLDALSKDK